MHIADIQAAIWADHILAGPHAANEAGAYMLTLHEIWQALLGPNAEIIEEYPLDPRGPSCLIYCEVNGMPEHVVVAYPCAMTASQKQLSELTFMITCYRPGGPKHAHKWSTDFKKRLP